MEKNDQQLVSDFLAGNEKSFELLVNKNLKPVYNFIYRLIGDVSLADDLTQEVFLKTWKNIRRYDEKKNFKVWLFAIAKNTVFDMWKKKKTVPFSFFEKEDGSNRLEDVAEDKILPDEVLMKIEEAGDLNKKLSLLSKQYRLILMMHYKDDLSLGEIAEVLDLPYNTVKSQHKRALNALEKFL